LTVFQLVSTHIPATGMDILRVQKIAKSQAWQRAGRAGRQASGFCYRTYTLQEFEKMPSVAVPEIQRCSLSSVVLQLLALGIQDPANFDFMDKPPPELVQAAMNELHLLGAIESTEKPNLTELGQQMAAFPLDPRFTKLILASKDLGCTLVIIFNYLNKFCSFIECNSFWETVNEFLISSSMLGRKW
jgi:ATP-dependent RNA helicase DHX33